MRPKLILLIMAVFYVTAHAQQPQSAGKSDGQQPVVNDDGGRAFVIGRDSKGLIVPSNHAGPVISEPQQYSIFLGSGWARRELRAREPELSNLLANVRDQATLRALDEYGTKNLFGATFSQERENGLKGNRDISDLQIQAVLGGMLNDGTLPKPNANMIYVIFLDPNLHSTLGSLIAGKHYAAYHNFFNASGTRLHYVVVPFEANQKTGCQIALRAFLAAAFNPNGAGS